MHGLIILDEGIFFSSLTKGHARWLSRYGGWMYHTSACMHGLIILDEGIFFSSLTKGHARWLSR
jgi:hypothetical protein